MASANINETIASNDSVSGSTERPEFFLYPIPMVFTMSNGSGVNVFHISPLIVTGTGGLNTPSAENSDPLNNGPAPDNENYQRRLQQMFLESFLMMNAMGNAFVNAQSASMNENMKRKGLSETLTDQIPRFDIARMKYKWDNKDCMICQECMFEDEQKDSKLRILPCNHVFHENCLFPWLKLSDQCPCCRLELTEENVIKHSSEIRFNAGCCLKSINSCWADDENSQQEHLLTLNTCGHAYHAECLNATRRIQNIPSNLDVTTPIRCLVCRQESTGNNV